MAEELLFERRGEKISDLLIRLVEALPGERVNIDDLFNGLGKRAFGLVILLLALPNSLPLPSPPGVSTLFGLPIALLAGQMALGYARPRLPGIVTRKSVVRCDLLSMLTKARPYMAKIERHIRPRLRPLASQKAQRLVGVLIAILAIILALPIVFGNFLPGLAILFLSLGLVEEDGGFILAGLILSVVAVIFVSSVVLVGYEAIKFALFHFLW